MPRVSNYTPAWLSRPSPGFDFFNKLSASPTKPINGHEHASSSLAPSRTLAQRGTQIFNVVGNELRWTDLKLLKEQWQTQRQQPRGSARGAPDAESEHETQPAPYRVLKVPVSRQIRQLSINPTGDYMAIITSHTVHIAVLPDPSHLNATDMSDLKLRTFQLGPTVHVLERSPVVSTVWHPLGVQGNALVTVTADSIIRLWELERSNRWSFDSPALAFDLKKLADGRSTAEDFSPSKYSTAKSFSPDSFEMDVASVCFGGFGLKGETPWASMTLWVAMKEGDVYALCPFLPAKSDPPEFLIKDLSMAVRCKALSLTRMPNVPSRQKKLANQQLAWLAEIENQPSGAILQRPSQPGSVPKLQGPFRLSPDPDLMFNITDIYAFSPTFDSDSADHSFGPADIDFVSSLELICLATNDGIVHLCANLDSIEACWLPTKRTSRLLEDEKTKSDPELLMIEAISLVDAPKVDWPLVTKDALASNLIHVTHSSGITSIDLSLFTRKLLEELNETTETGIEFRLGMLLDNSPSFVHQFINFTHKPGDDSTNGRSFTACVNIFDEDLGDVLLTTATGLPYAVTIDEDGGEINMEGDTNSDTAELELQGILNSESRPSYQPPEEFWTNSTLPSFMDRHIHSRSRRFMSEEVRISQTTLNLLMEAHRVLSNETHRLGVAASDLFNRCERLQDEFQEQINFARDGADRVDAVLGEDADYYEGNADEGLFGGNTTSEIVAERLATARERQQGLSARYDELRSKLSSLNGRALSEKEKTWIAEVNSMSQLVGQAQSDANNQQSEEASFTQAVTRYENIKKLKTMLLDEVKEAADKAAPASSPAATNAGTKSQADGDQEQEIEQAGPDTSLDVLNVKPDRRRARLAEITAMLERQTALVDATKAKLERLDRASI